MAVLQYNLRLGIFGSTMKHGMPTMEWLPSKSLTTSSKPEGAHLPNGMPIYFGVVQFITSS